MPGTGQNGRVCNTFGMQNAPKTDTNPMRTRVYPVILCFYTVIPEPKKTLPPLRILKKKISKQKNVQTGWTQGEFSNPQGKFRNFFLKVCAFFFNSGLQFQFLFKNISVLLLNAFAFVAMSVSSPSNCQRFCFGVEWSFATPEPS